MYNITLATRRRSKSQSTLHCGLPIWLPAMPGDEFVILLHEVENTAAAENVRLKIEDLLKGAVFTRLTPNRSPEWAGAVGLQCSPRRQRH